jgi:hypothetical protein
MNFFENGEDLARATYLTSKQPSHFCGLDLGQVSDYSALVILERRGTSPKDYTFDCKYLKRWELRTSYPQIVEDTVRIVNSPPLTQNVRDPTFLSIDSTGVGMPIADLFRRAPMKRTRLIPIYITSGSDVSRDGDVRRVPKLVLVSNVAIALQNGKLQISKKLALSGTLIEELGNFKAKISNSGNTGFGAGSDWRENSHDDLVLALAFALWTANDGVKAAKFYSM